MKNITCLFAWMILLAMLPGQPLAQNLYVLEHSGQQTSYMINDIRKLQFSSGELIIEMTGGGSENYILGDIRYLNFTDLVGMVEKPVVMLTQVNLFPNPVNSTLHIEYPHTPVGSVSFDIFSMDGRQVYSKTWPGGSGAASWQADISSFAPGTYLCRFRSGQEAISKKIVKK